MSVGASEHRTFVRAKARFAGEKAQEHSFVRRNAVFSGHICHVSLAAFSGGKCRACLALPEVPASDLPVLIHSRWNATCQALCGSVASRCEPVPVFPLLPRPSTCPAELSTAFTPASRDSGSRPGTMAAGARKQAASCDAFVLSRRLPAPGAPPSRTFPACLVAKPFPEPSRPPAATPKKPPQLRKNRKKP